MIEPWQLCKFIGKGLNIKRNRYGVNIKGGIVYNNIPAEVEYELANSIMLGNKSIKNRVLADKTGTDKDC